MLEAGIASEETYVQQAHQWKATDLPMHEVRRRDAISPTCCWPAYSTTDEFQHQFLGLVTKTLPGGQRNPAYDDVDLDHRPDGRVQAREAFIRDAYKECGRDA